MEPENYISLYEDQLKRYLLLSKGLVPRMKRRQDQKICIYWIQRILSLSSCIEIVGRDSNKFFEFLIKVIQETVVEDILKDDPGHEIQSFKQIPIEDIQAVEDPLWLHREINIPPVTEKAPVSDAPYFAHWSHDQKTYIAAKALPNKGALVYMAVSTDPSLGWSNLS